MNNNKPFSWELFHKTPVVGIFRGSSLNSIVKVAQICLETEFYTIEVTMNTPQAEDVITTLRSKFDGLNIGAGTVCTISDLDNAIRADAQFIVTPIIDEKVIKKAVDLRIPIFPGAYTPTEIYKAWSLGASGVKVFPASQLGPKYIKDVLAPLNDIKLLPTGGVNKENISTFFDVGAYGVGMGSSLFDAQMIHSQDYDNLRNHMISIRSQLSE